MSKPPEIINLAPDNFDKKYADLVKGLASILNPFFIQVHQALNKSITVGDNLLGAIKSMTITGGSPITFKYDGGGSPVGLLLASITPESGNAAIAETIGALQWYKSSTTEITIHPIKGLVTGTKYQITVIILGS